ncbi:manganese/iron transport system permease protein [Monaibacterium marinum]|uniref:Manganese/iron transport system permease protein n=1 Tax=Pontivivens marinum TaxID=1690039 RepID=A0A2C9CNR9_9RHOB|nr:metal ABC transporter permease [Monaibacterium marinum]SOH92872.1 manganese/iron transport system permease protein [Monaibacterium marinum]
MDWTTPFIFDFMQRAFVISVLIAVPMAMLSCFLVLRGWSLMGDAISHAVLPGIVLAYVAGIPLAVGAFFAGMFCAVSTGWLNLNSRIKEDTVMGVVFSGMFGLGIVLFAAVPSNLHLDHILFGDMLGIGWSDIGWTGLVAIVITLALLVLRADLMALIFDPAHAQAIGLPVRALHYGLLAMISLSVVSALTAIGIILAIGLLIAPGAIAFLWTRRFGPMLAVATGVSVVAAVSGVYLSFWLDSAPAPTIILLLTATFTVSFIITVRRDRRARQAA